jgi:hypothetical protein
MACEKIHDWDWINGDEKHIITKEGFNLSFNYFTCSTNFFDGIFHCVKFPKGMRLYHGSPYLAYFNNEYPAGINYYNQHININLLINTLEKNKSNIDEAIANQISVEPAWFSSYNIAQLYSLRNRQFPVCKDKCIATYRLKNDATFILINNDFNIWKILSNEAIPKEIKQNLKQMFSLQQAVINNIDGKITIKNKIRKSDVKYEIPFAKWLCQNVNYAGYAADVTKTDTRGFHLEFMICNPIKWLERDLSSPIDWQYFSTYLIPPETKQLLEQMKLYKSINVNFHAGNLFEHSIWSALFAEQIIFNTPHILKILFNTEDLRVSFSKKIVAIALLHDIGKMDPFHSKSERRESDFIYFSIKDHPEIGGQYIRGTKQIPVLNLKTLEVEKFFNIKKLFNELGLDYSTELETVAKIIDLHWQLGILMYDPDGVNKYLSLLNSSKDFIFAILIISIADILASQPYGVNNLTAELNHHSKFFPFISNVPRKYKGGNIADTSAEKRKEFINKISNKIFNTNF